LNLNFLFTKLYPVIYLINQNLNLLTLKEYLSLFYDDLQRFFMHFIFVDLIHLNFYFHFVFQYDCLLLHFQVFKVKEFLLVYIFHSL
jgi:hypothetical protein